MVQRFNFVARMERSEIRGRLASGSSFPGFRFAPSGLWSCTLPHHARGKPGFPARRLDVFLQEAMRFLAGIARPRIGPGAAFVVGGAGGLAGVVAFAAVEVETPVVA